VVDNLNDRVQVFNAKGRFLSQWGSLGSGDGQFNDPEGIAVDAAGCVYVSDGGDSDNHRVQVFRPTVVSGPST
jgi:DNA-binding beta-propeller fold protein YncE